MVAMEVVASEAMSRAWEATASNAAIRTIYTETCAALPSPESRGFLAGMFTARGRVYIGASLRNGSPKYAPSLSVELSRDEVPMLNALLGEPSDRGYYGTPTKKWVTQDRDTIAAMCLLLAPLVPRRIGQQMLAMLHFCVAENALERLDAFEAFKLTQGIKITRGSL